MRLCVYWVKRLATGGVTAWLACAVLAGACGSRAAKSIAGSVEAGAGGNEAGPGVMDAGAEDAPELPDTGGQDGTALDASTGSSDGGLGTLGRTCPTEGALACNGSAQKLKLICQGGEWAMNGVCAAGQNCYQPDGTCHPVVPGCEHQAGGFTFCEGLDVVRTCDADGVVADSSTCAGVCQNGECLPPCCGDAKVEADEECDDGNTTPLDGCEPRICKRSRVLSLALGWSHTCALTVGGYVRCWGDNTYGQLGLGHENFEADRQPCQLTDAQGNPAGPIDLGGEAIAIGAGKLFVCALLTDQTIRCWGQNDDGQLGLGHADPVVGKTPRALGSVSTGGKATALAVGGAFACAVLEGGVIRCWGDNATGELGLGTTVPVSKSLLPSQAGAIVLGDKPSAIAAGEEHVCALLSGGAVRCWGYNHDGQLGLGHTDSIGDDELPSDDEKGAGIVPFPQGRSARFISAGRLHTCAVLDDGSLECWGANESGELGLGHTNDIGDNESPAESGIVATGTKISSIAAGGLTTCALGSGFGLRCWGANRQGQLGLSDTQGRGMTPATVPEHLNAILFDPGVSAQSVYTWEGHTCALLDDANVRCWGYNGRGELGFGYRSGVLTGTEAYVGGDVDHTPDKLPSINVFPPR